MTLVGCGEEKAPAGPSTKAASPSSSGQSVEPAGESARLAAQWIAQELVDGSHAESEYDGSVFADNGLTIDAMWALVAAGEPALAQKAADWLALRDNAIDYAGDGEQAAYPSAMGKLALAYLTPGLKVEPEYKSAEELATSLIGRLKPEGRFRDISEWGDNSTPAGQAFDIMLLVRLGQLDGLSVDPVAALMAISCDDGSYPSMFDAEQPCTGDVDTTAIVAQALFAAGQDAAAEEAFTYLLQAQTEPGRWQNSGADSVNSTGLAVSTLSLWESAEAKSAVKLGVKALIDWQLPATGAFPGGERGESDLRATVQGVLGLQAVSYLKLLGIQAQ
jgi:hypothetical protein